MPRLMRLLLVNPRVPPSFWTLADARDITGRAGLMPSLALATIAALTPDDVEVTVVDEAVEPVDFSWDGDLVGITGYVTQKHRILEIAAGFRDRGIPVAIGGAHASLVPEQYEDAADILFVGECEQTWPQFMADWKAGDWSSVYRADEVDMTTSPAPRNDVLDEDAFYLGSVQVSRGCPFECEFCDVIIYVGRKQRHKAPDQIVTELDDLYERGVRSVFLCDDNLTAHRGRIGDILAAVRDWNAARDERVSFITQVSIDIARDNDAELLDLAADAGLAAAFVGIETPDPASLKEVKKRQNVRDDLVEDVHRLQRRGIQVMGGHIVGFDSDTTACFETQLDFISAAGIPVVALTVLNAPETTPLFERLGAEGRLSDEYDKLRDRGGFVLTNIIPKQMSSDELEAGAVWLMNRLYAPRQFLERVEMLAAHLPDAEVDPQSSQTQFFIDVWRRTRRAFRPFGPDHAKLPQETMRLLKGKDPFHMLLALTFAYNEIRLLQRWDLFDPDPAPHPPVGRSVAVGG